MPRILLTTRCRDSGLYDYFRENAPRNVRWRFAMPRRISFGLRFLRQNLPGLAFLSIRRKLSSALRFAGAGMSSASPSTSRRLMASLRWLGKRELLASPNCGPETMALSLLPSNRTSITSSLVTAKPPWLGSSVFPSTKSFIRLSSLNSVSRRLVDPGWCPVLLPWLQLSLQLLPDYRLCPSAQAHFTRPH
jgi:hypothetical protein